MKRKVMLISLMFLMMFMMPINGNAQLPDYTYIWDVSPGEYDYTKRFLRVEDSVHIQFYLKEGEEFSFLIVDTENFNKWKQGDVFLSYSNKIYDTIRSGVIFHPPYEDTWYFMLHLMESSSSSWAWVEVDMDVYIAPTTSGTPYDINGIILLVVMFVSIGIIAIYVFKKSEMVEELPKETIEKTEKVLEEPVIDALIKVLIVCPFCGKKNEQGIGKCQNCGADL